MKGLFITFEGTEGSGKSTQVRLLADHLLSLHYPVTQIREPGGTPIGEEIRHTVQHSAQNQDMTPEAELLLINASRAQLVRQVIRPALLAGQIVLCDRFYDSTVAYQGYGRGLDLALVNHIIDFAVGDTRPALTFLIHIPLELSDTRRSARHAARPHARDRMEEAGRLFFQRVEQGYHAIAKAQPSRFKVIDGAASIASIQAQIWAAVEPMLSHLLK